MQSDKAVSRFIDSMIDDIAKNRLEFPTLPEVAMRVRRLIQQPDVSSTQLAKVITTDAALTSRLLQVANSAMFSGLPRVENAKAAVNRLGHALVRNMVTCIVMKSLYQPRVPPLFQKMLQDQWRHTTRVAAISQVMARRYNHLRPDEAMLGGLIHDIGTLPILNRAAKDEEIAEHPEKVSFIVRKLHTEIGRLILEAWNFPKGLADVAALHEDLFRLPRENLEYVDIVMVANLHSYIGTEHRLAKMDWSKIPVFDKLGLTPAESIQSMRDAQHEVNTVYQLLKG